MEFLVTLYCNVDIFHLLQHSEILSYVITILKDIITLVFNIFMVQ